MTRRVLVAAATLLWMGSLALRTPVQGQSREVQPGDPLPGLTPREFSEFRLGLDDFTEVETAEEGLGPAFNGTSCAVCHNVPAIGGAGLVLETRAGYRNADGSFQGLNEAGDTLVHLFSTPTHGCQPSMPDDVTVIARRAPIPLFGAGLVEAIPDDTLLALADPLDRNRDGVSGRAASIVDVATGDRRVGRFGWKAQHATLLAFGADAYLNEMGITNDLFQREGGHGIPQEQMQRCDPFPDPEDRADRATGRRGIDNFESFMRFLAPIARGASDEVSRDGERLFAAIGCTSCHVPALTTGTHANPLFDRRPVALFSDLLLHDIGTGDGIRQADASPEEIRTPALWGLRMRRPLLHDGSAATIADAIARHRAEAELARRGFERLSDAERGRLIAFLRSL
jgi:CxxC motif-containing protein (DUF1111 family)